MHRLKEAKKASTSVNEQFARHIISYVIVLVFFSWLPISGNVFLHRQ